MGTSSSVMGHLNPNNPNNCELYEQIEYKSLLDSFPIAHTLQNIKTQKLEYFNNAFKQLFRVPVNPGSENLGSLILYNIGLAEFNGTDLEMCRGKIKTYEMQCELTTIDKSPLFVQVTRNLIHQNGEQYILSCYKEIENKDELIQNSKYSKYNFVFQNAPNAIAIFDFELKKYIDCNKSFVELYGYERIELSELTAIDLAWACEKIKIQSMLKGINLIFKN